MSRTPEQLNFITEQKIKCINCINGLQRNASALFAMCAVYQDPRKFLNLTQGCQTLLVQDTIIDTNEAFGLDLQNAVKRKERTEELGSQAKRILVAESIELITHMLATTNRYLTTGKNPYESEQHFSVGFAQLQASGRNEAGYYIFSNEKKFLKAISDIRGFIRHNNSHIPPKKAVYFQGNVLGMDVTIDIKWRKELPAEKNLIAASIGAVLMYTENLKTLAATIFDRMADPNYKPQ